MNTLIQCPCCYEEMNHADWQASEGSCPHCGKATPSTSGWLTHRRDMGAYRARVALCHPSLLLSGFRTNSPGLTSNRRVYA